MGKWGSADDVGTLNYTRPEDMGAASRLVRKGEVTSLALNFEEHGPHPATSKYPATGCINPLHVTLRTGTEANAGGLDYRGLPAAAAIAVMPPQSETQCPARKGIVRLCQKSDDAAMGVVGDRISSSIASCK